MLWACSAGLKNTVPADYCERKILFWQDVNSDSVREKTSQPAGFKPAEHAEKWSMLTRIIKQEEMDHVFVCKRNMACVRFYINPNVMSFCLFNDLDMIM